MSPHVAISDPPELKDRFQTVLPYAKAGVFKSLCQVDISQRVGANFVDPEHSKSTWGVFITERTREGVNQLANLQAAYGSIFADEINLLMGRVISHPWNEFLIASKRRAEAGGKRPLCSLQPSMRKAYESLVQTYWPILHDLETKIGRRHCALRKKLNTSDSPPLFLRSIKEGTFALK
jgi:hypothetical protein